MNIPVFLCEECNKNNSGKHSVIMFTYCNRCGRKAYCFLGVEEIADISTTQNGHYAVTLKEEQPGDDAQNLPDDKNG